MTMHEGHRQRVRERFRQAGLEGFAPHEVLELLLFYAKARGDTNPLAHRLLTTFGSLRGVLEAPPEQLMLVDGVGEETATFLSLLVPVFRRYEACLCEETKHLRTFTDTVDYCCSLMAGLRQERFCVVCVSSQMKVLGVRTVAEGSLMEVSAYPRMVVETALNHNAYAVLLCHNHPGGEARPSPADVDMTADIQRVLTGLDIRLMDHIIVADGKVYSMVYQGDMATEFTGAKRHEYPRNRLTQAWADEWL